MSSSAVTFQSMAGPFMATGPQDGSQGFALDQWLQSYSGLSAGEQCMVLQWVMTGRNDAWFYEPDGAVEICKKAGCDVDLSDALDQLQKNAGEQVPEAIKSWANRKELKWQAVQDANVKQDTKKIVKEVGKGVTKTLDIVTTAAENVAETAGFIVPVVVGVLAYLAYKTYAPKSAGR